MSGRGRDKEIILLYLWQWPKRQQVDKNGQCTGTAVSPQAGDHVAALTPSHSSKHFLATSPAPFSCPC